MLKLSSGSCMLRLGLRLSIGSCMLRLGLRLRLSFRGSGGSLRPSAASTEGGRAAEGGPPPSVDSFSEALMQTISLPAGWVEK